MRHVRRHVDPASSSGRNLIGTKRHIRFTRQKMHDRRHGRRMLGKLLTGCESEKDGFEMVVLVNGPTKRAVRGRLDLSREVGNNLKGFFHGSVLANVIQRFDGNDRDGRQMLLVFSKDSSHCQDATSRGLVPDDVKDETNGVEKSFVLH